MVAAGAAPTSTPSSLDVIRLEEKVVAGVVRALMVSGPAIEGAPLGTEVLERIRAIVRPTDFSDERMRAVWAAILRVRTRGGRFDDAAPIAAELRNHGEASRWLLRVASLTHQADALLPVLMPRAVDVRCAAMAREEFQQTETPPALTVDLRTFVGDEEPVDDEKPSPEDWVVPGLVPRAGVTILGGPPKACKTYVLLDMALAVATGKPFCGFFPAFPGRVMAFLEEDTKRRIRSRLWWLARGRGLDPRGLGDAIRLSVMTGFRLDRDGFLDRLEAEIAAFRPSVLMFDALARLHSADENDRTAMRAITVPLQDLCSKHGLAIVMIHHFRGLREGDEEKRSGDLLRGTTDLHALARSVVGLRRRKEGFLALDAGGNDGDLPFHRLDFVREVNDRGKTTVQFVCKGPLADSALAEDAEKVLELVRQSMPTGLSTRELRDGVKGMGKDRLDTATDHLAEKGTLYRYNQKAPWMTRDGVQS